MKRLIAQVVVPLLIGCVLAGSACAGGKLSRSRAETLIRDQLKLPADESENLLVEYSTFGSETGSTIDKLQQAGLVTYVNRWIGMTYHVEGQLTPIGAEFATSGKQAMGDNYTSGIMVKVASIDFGEVTGIVEAGNGNTSLVNYTLLRKGVTPFGTIAFHLQDVVIPASAMFIKFDDGWRIQDLGIRMSLSPRKSTADQAEALNKRAQGRSGPSGSGTLEKQGQQGSVKATSLSSMTPREQFDRLVDRITTAGEGGDTATIARFSPMAAGAYQNLPPADRDADARFHMGWLHLLARQYSDAAALADTILSASPNHLLGYYLRAEIARAQGDSARLRIATTTFRAQYDMEMAKKDRTEYVKHRAMLERFRDGKQP